MGATFKLGTGNPDELFVQNGYRRLAWFSLVEKAAEYQSKKIPKFIARTFLRTLTGGYAIYVFASK